jgi:hypothetical protein
MPGMVERIRPRRTRNGTPVSRRVPARARHDTPGASVPGSILAGWATRCCTTSATRPSASSWPAARCSPTRCSPPRPGPLRRVVPPPPASAWSGVDLVLVSHLHGDHLHLRSLRMLGRRSASSCRAGPVPGCAAAGCTGSTSSPPGSP